MLRLTATGDYRHLLTHVRRGDVVMVHSLPPWRGQAIEAVAHGDRTSSRVVGRAVEDIKLPEAPASGAIVRGDEVIIAPWHGDRIGGPCHPVSPTDKRRISDVERLFQVGITFL